MRQTLAIFIDAYRAINARKLFWITLGISGLVVAAFAIVGINDKGLTFLGWQTQVPPTTAIFTREVFYKTMFVSLGVSFWITWAAAILALISTAGIIPDLITDGSVDLVLSKPIGRVRLFLTKFVSGLLFVALQIGVFCLASFLVIGLRGGAWEPRVFLAIPIVLIFFSYLFSVCALIGLVTRSTIAALLLTLLFWFAIFGVHATESSLLMFRTASERRVELYEQDIARREAELEQARTATDGGIAQGVRNAFTLPGRERALERRREQLADGRENLQTLSRFHDGALIAKTLLPKTSETIRLVERWLVDLSDLQSAVQPQTPIIPEELTDEPEELSIGDQAMQQDAARRVGEVVRERSIAWIVGTSLAFEAIVLGIACFIFVRRDF